jgi:hypothetical protein
MLLKPKIVRKELHVVPIINFETRLKRVSPQRRDTGKWEVACQWVGVCQYRSRSRRKAGQSQVDRCCPCKARDTLAYPTIRLQ